MMTALSMRSLLAERFVRTRRHGFSVIELLGALSLLAILSLLIGPAAVQVLDQLGREPVRIADHRLAEDLLDRLGRDVRAATTMPESAGGFRAGPNTLILGFADGRTRGYRIVPGGVELVEQLAPSERRPAAGEPFKGSVQPLPVTGRFERVVVAGRAVAVRVRWELIGRSGAGGKPIPLRAVFALRTGGRP